MKTVFFKIIILLARNVSILVSITKILGRCEVHVSGWKNCNAHGSDDSIIVTTCVRTYTQILENKVLL